jgi:hypothetical protein
MVFNATSNNISVVSWRSFLLVEKTTSLNLLQVTGKLYHILPNCKVLHVYKVFFIFNYFRGFDFLVFYCLVIYCLATFDLYFDHTC